MTILEVPTRSLPIRMLLIGANPDFCRETKETRGNVFEEYAALSKDTQTACYIIIYTCADKQI